MNRLRASHRVLSACRRTVAAADRCTSFSPSSASVAFSTAAASTAEQFQRDGFVVVEDLFTAAEMRQCKDAMLDFIRDGAPAENDRGQRMEDSGIAVWMDTDIPAYFGALLASPASPLLRVVGSSDIMQPAGKLEFLSAKPVLKTGTVEFASPWHQDWMYWRGSTKISVWLAVDDATEENGCLKVLPGSHRHELDHGGHQEKVRALGCLLLLLFVVCLRPRVCSCRCICISTTEWSPKGAAATPAACYRCCVCVLVCGVCVCAPLPDQSYQSRSGLISASPRRTWKRWRKTSAGTSSPSPSQKAVPSSSTTCSHTAPTLTPTGRTGFR